MSQLALADDLQRQFLVAPYGLELGSLKELVTSLQRQRHAREARLEILQDRLQATNHELSYRLRQAKACHEELYGRQRQAQRPRPLDADAAETHAATAALVRSCVEGQLLQAKAEKGLRSDRGCLVEGYPDPGAELSRDTVLVTHVEPHAEERRCVSYRIVEETTIHGLKEDACTYWGLNPVEFVLKAMNGSKLHDAMRVAQCFREREESHLVLVYKTPKSEAVLPSEVADILPKTGRKRLHAAQQEVHLARAAGRMRCDAKKPLAEQMQRLPGLFSFMTQRDGAVKRHLERLRLSSLCAYTLLCLFTAFSAALLKPPQAAFECADGIAETLEGATPFGRIRCEEEVWGWLEGTVPAQLLSEDSMLREYNYLVGDLKVLMQRVSLPNCLEANDTCAALVFRAATADRARDGELESYWQARVGQDGRSASSRPWEYQDREKRPGASPDAGAFHGNEASGHSIEYQLQYTPLSAVHAAFLEDLRFLQSIGWLSQMRALHVSFLAYNANHRIWVWNQFSFEHTAFGTIHPLVYQQPFRPRLFELGQDVELLVCDVARVCLALFVIFQIYSDARHAWEQGWTQVLRVQALADLMILALFFTSLGYRLAFYTAATSAEYATSRPQAGVTAGRFGVQAVLEAFLLAFCLFRVVYFLRVNRHVFIIWRSLARGLSLLARLLPLLLLLFLGFQVLGMAVGNRDRQCSRSLGSMAGCLLLLISGDLRIAELQRGESLRIIYVILVCVVGRLVVANAWLSVLMQEYHTVRVEAGFSSQTYRWKENDWVRYILPWPLDKLYLKIRSLHMPFSGLVQRFQK